MKRSLLLALAVALTVVASAQAHESWHEATGAIASVSPTSIAVKGNVIPPAAQPTPDLLTCAVTSRSPRVAGLERGDRVYIVCDWVDARQTLMILVPQRVVRKFSGKIASLSAGSISVRTTGGRVTCGVTTATRSKLRGMKVGHAVNMVCRKAGSKLVLVDLTARGAHAGH